MEFLTHGWDLAAASSRATHYPDDAAELGLRTGSEMLKPECRGSAFLPEVEVASTEAAIDRPGGFHGSQSFLASHRLSCTHKALPVGSALRFRSADQQARRDADGRRARQGGEDQIWCRRAVVAGLRLAARSLAGRQRSIECRAELKHPNEGHEPIRLRHAFPGQF
jgi:hypothetical protein